MGRVLVHKAHNVLALGLVELGARQHQALVLRLLRPSELGAVVHVHVDAAPVGRHEALVPASCLPEGEEKRGVRGIAQPRGGDAHKVGLVDGGCGQHVALPHAHGELGGVVQVCNGCSQAGPPGLGRVEAADAAAAAHGARAITVLIAGGGRVLQAQVVAQLVEDGVNGHGIGALDPGVAEAAAPNAGHAVPWAAVVRHDHHTALVFLDVDLEHVDRVVGQPLHPAVQLGRIALVGIPGQAVVRANTGHVHIREVNDDVAGIVKPQLAPGALIVVVLHGGLVLAKIIGTVAV
mmetsp:Transcript_28900/g.73788  ORF Transcript_28900/g.73788 Transcript_28900/m.73788 type:complete len:292 (-) Transcript_28900:586-1461(-)